MSPKNLDSGKDKILKGFGCFTPLWFPPITSAEVGKIITETVLHQLELYLKHQFYGVDYSANGYVCTPYLITFNL